MSQRYLFPLLAFSLAAFGCGDDPVVTVDPLQIVTTSLGGAIERESYVASIEAKGGSERNYSWAVTEGALPTGLFLAAAGTPATTISGSPRMDGSFSFTVAATDGLGATVSRAFTLVVEEAPPELALEAPNLPPAILGAPYMGTITASGGSGEGYRWSIASGALPAGLTLSPEGTPSATISGTPTEAKNFDFSVRVRDSEGNRDDLGFTVVVMDTSLPLEIITSSLDAGEQDQPYSTVITGANGAGEGYQWSLRSGELPAGLRLSAEGTPSATLSGTPTESGSFSFRVELEDVDGDFVRKTFFLDIAEPPPPLRITTFELPDGAQGEPYRAEITAINGVNAGYMWTVSEGALPAGLSLDPQGTPSTTITGTPTEFGNFTFTIEVTDLRGETEDFTYRIEISEIVIPITITSTALPNGLLGQPYEATLTARDGFGEYSWIVDEGELPAGLELEVDGTPSTMISGIAGEWGTFTATVTVFDWNNDTYSRSFTFEIIDSSLPILITTPSGMAFPLATACSPYSVELRGIEGSNQGYQWEVVAGSLPPGLTLDLDGTPSTRLHGLPPFDAVGTYNFTVQLADGANHITTRDFTLEVAAGAGGQRWAAMVGDMITDGDIEVAVADICRATPGTPIPLNPAAAGFGDASTSTDHTAFSPDGSKIAFRGDLTNDNVFEVYVANLSGNPAARSAVRVNGAMVTNGDVNDFKWSPDGNWLAYHADQDTDGLNELYVVNVSGPVPGPSMKVNGSFLTPSGDVEFDDFLFSPDSTRIAYVADQDTLNVFELYVTDLSSGTAGPAMKVNGALPSTSADVDDFIMWSPDSQWLIYHADQVTAFEDQIWRRNVVTMAAPQVINAPVGSGDVRINSNSIGALGQDYMVSPDGSQLFYIANSNNTANDELFWVDLSGATPGAAVLLNTALPTNGDVFNAAWSPDGTRILYMGDVDVDNEYELYVVDVSGATPSAPQQVNGPLVTNGDVQTSQLTGYEWSPDGNFVAYRADQRVDNIIELFVVDVTGPTPWQAQVANPTLPSFSDVDNFLWAPDVSGIAYRVDPVTSSQTELYYTPITNLLTGTPVRASGVMVTGGDVSNTTLELYFSVDGTRLYYQADQVVDNNFEAWVVDVSTPVPSTPTRLSPMLPINGDVNRTYLQQ